MSIFIVEIPHQRAPRVWSASNEQDFINVMREFYERNCSSLEQECDIPMVGYGEQDEDGDYELYEYERKPNIEDACNALREDLHSCYIFMDRQQAQDALDDGDITGHGSVHANALLKEELVSHNE